MLLLRCLRAITRTKWRTRRSDIERLIGLLKRPDYRRCKIVSVESKLLVHAYRGAISGIWWTRRTGDDGLSGYVVSKLLAVITRDHGRVTVIVNAPITSSRV
jgi:hypothetical protein